MNRQHLARHLVALCVPMAFAAASQGGAAPGATFMLNPAGSNGATSLNGTWNAIIDPFSRGEAMGFHRNRRPTRDDEFLEYGFDGGPRLEVPGDFNSQLPELMLYEGNVWYQRTFAVARRPGHRQFLWFAGASYVTRAWVNGKEVGVHEGGFTPFQFEITEQVAEGANDLVVLVNNERRVDGIPAMRFDWWNYGGILRDVLLVERPAVHVDDYLVQLAPDGREAIAGHVQLAGAGSGMEVRLEVEGLGIDRVLVTDDAGRAAFEIACRPERWEPGNPRLYRVRFSVGEDRVEDEIGFRTIEVRGTEILLNGKPLFLRGVNFHEEIPQRKGRAHSDADAAMLLHEARELGCNFVRTAHYPQNERLLRQAERMGLLVWEEIPVWQGIEFTNPAIFAKAESMLRDMIRRDRNRASVIFWSIANETKPSADRDRVLCGLVDLVRQLDPSRLVTAAFDNPRFDAATSTFRLEDRLAEAVDVVGVNKYLGWYQPFPVPPEQVRWEVAPGKPLVFSEFGAEARYGERGPDTVAHRWSEDYQERVFRQSLVMFANIPNLRGTAPWVLFDFRSPYRCHPIHQQGWNRKGLVSDQGQRKRAWHVVKDYYDRLAGGR